MSRSDTQSSVTSETLKSLQNNIQGYIGYGHVKDRKISDQALRKYWYDRVLELLDNFSKVQTQLMQGQLLSTWSASNSIMKMLQDLKILLTTDVYRHSTFFETPDVSDSLDLDVIYVLESETILEFRDIRDSMQVVQKKLEELELLEIEKDILRIRNRLDAVKTTISDRAELIASFELVNL